MNHVKKSQGVRSLGSKNKSVKVNDVQIKEFEKNEDGTADYAYTIEILLIEG
jgi:hypothetical protein